jgi:hypothetical protein
LKYPQIRRRLVFADWHQHAILVDPYADRVTRICRNRIETRGPAAPIGEDSTKRLSAACPASRPSSWYGVGAPKSTSGEIVDKLNKEINAFLSDPR